MSLSSPDMQAAKGVIDAHERLLIIPHANVDPDGLSSALACHALFSTLGKDCTVICPDTLPESLEFLPGFSALQQTIDEGQNFVITLDTSSGVEVDKLRYTVEDQKVNIIVVPKKGRFHRQDVGILDAGSAYDLIIVVDSADLQLLGSLYSDHIELFSQTPILNIDHHISNSHFGQLQLIDPTAASATEVLYHWFLAFPEWKKHLTADLATLLLTGLITDTRSFQNPNTTPRSLEVAAELLDLGARQQEIIQHIYKTKPLTTLKIWGRALNRIQMDQDARIVWSSVSREDLDEMGATSKQTHGILDELISTIPDADVHVLFTEVESGGFKASLRSSDMIDVNRAAGRLFGGGGHAKAAGFRMTGYSNFQLCVVDCVRQLIAEMTLQRQEADAKRPPLSPIPTPQSSLHALPTDYPSTSHTAPSSSSVGSASIDVVESILPRSDRRDSTASSTDVVASLGEA